MLKKIDEIKLVLVRASEQLEWLRQHVRHPDPDFVPANEGWFIEEHVGDLIVAEIRLRFGEFAATLRNALNYVACAFAEQDSGNVGKLIQFPIEETPLSFAGQCGSYLAGVASKHLALFEKLQPYNAGNWIKDLRTFSNWYRHRGLIKVQKVFQRPPRFATPSKAYWQGNIKVEVNTEFFVAVALEDGRPIIQTLEEIHRRVSEAIDEFNLFLRI